MLTIPLPTNSDDSKSHISMTSPNHLSEDSRIMEIVLPDRYQIEPGIVDGKLGFAYIVDDMNRIYFVDPINDTTQYMSIPTGTSQHHSITGKDIDGDGSTEFLFINLVSGSQYALAVADINDGSTFQIYSTILYPSIEVFGDFDNDTGLDVALVDSGMQYVETFDLVSRSIIGKIDAGFQCVDMIASGDYGGTGYDAIAIGVISTVHSLRIYLADGTLVDSITHTGLRNIATFDYAGGADDIALVDDYGDFTVYQGSDLSELYSVTYESYSTNQINIVPANLTGDNQNDLYIMHRESQRVYIMNGQNGDIINFVENMYVDLGDAEHDLGIIDADNVIDLALKTTDNKPCFIRGGDMTLGYTEILIEATNQISAFDINNDGYEDIITRTLENVNIILSDSQIPTLEDMKIDPKHPTVLDEFITVSISATDITGIDLAEFYYRPLGETTWIKPHDSMFQEGSRKGYLAFLVGLANGVYEYYMKFHDSYLNYAFFGSAESPENFSVIGHYEWETAVDFGLDSPHYNLIAEGNTTTGDSIFYTLEPDGSTLWLRKHLPSGECIANQSIDNTGGYDYILETGMIDGDSVLDPIVLQTYNPDKTVVTRSLFFRGTDLSVYNQGEASYAVKQFIETLKFDGDQNSKIDLYMLKQVSPFALQYVNDDATWRSFLFDDGNNNDKIPQGLGGFNPAGSPNGLIFVARSDVNLYKFNALTLEKQAVINVTLELPYTDVDYVDMIATTDHTGEERLLVFYTFWRGTTTDLVVFEVDESTTHLDTPALIIPDSGSVMAHTFNYDNDIEDEVFILSSTGRVYHYEFWPTIDPIWNVQITESSPHLMTNYDFNGDADQELIIFTEQDESMTTITLDGEIYSYNKVGEVYDVVPIGDIDDGEGMDFAAYPVIHENSVYKGGLRDIDWFYRLFVSQTFGPIELLQGDIFTVNVTVANIHQEIVDDSSVYMTANYSLGEETIENTFGFYYSSIEDQYMADPSASWPIGIVNLTLRVTHDFYHTYETHFLDALTIKSPLEVFIDTPERIAQKEDQTVNVTVFDSLGLKVVDANVTIVVEGNEYQTQFSNSFYTVSIENITLDTGVHNIIATAEHPFSTETGLGSTQFVVETLASELLYTHSFPNFIDQGEHITAWINITDQFIQPLSEAIVNVRTNEGILTLTEINPGCYLFNHTIELPLGAHELLIEISSDYISGQDVGGIYIEVFGNLKPSIFYEPLVQGGSNFTLEIFVQDSFGPIHHDATVWVDIDGTSYHAIATNGALYLVTPNATFPVGRHTFVVHVESEYGFAIESNHTLIVESEGQIQISSSCGWCLIQGNSTELKLNLTDWCDTPVSGAKVTLFIGTTSLNLVHVGSGVYTTTLSTSGWKPGQYDYTVFVDHDYLTIDEPMSGIIDVVGQLIVGIDTLSTVKQNELVTFRITVTDIFGTPLSDLNISVQFMGITEKAAEVNSVGIYEATILVPGDRWYGDNQVVVSIEGELIAGSMQSTSVYVEPQVPDLTMNITSLTWTAGTSFILSFLGLILYFKLSSSMNLRGTTEENLKKSLRRMDLLYGVIVILAGAALSVSYLANLLGQPGLALTLTVILLGTSVLLYGIWLYRDAVSAMLLRGRLDRKRMVLGLWHLFFVPIVVWFILLYGGQIDWFHANVIAKSIEFEGISIPTIMTTIFTAYVSSILIVVVNLYREVSKGTQKIDHMMEEGTPRKIVDEEKSLMVKKFGSSIRIKFLMFLVVVAGATVTSMEFLQSYSLGAIVLMPVLFLVVIPFISSKLIQLFQRISRIGDKQNTTPI